LVNNAGIAGQIGPLDWLHLSDYKSCFDVNLFGLIDTTVTFLPLIKQEKGRIVNMTSILGRTTVAPFAPYVLSKQASEAFSDILRYINHMLLSSMPTAKLVSASFYSYYNLVSCRRQLIDYGCSVHIIEPGFYTTNIANKNCATKSLEYAWNRLPSEVKREYGGQEYFHTGK